MPDLADGVAPAAVPPAIRAALERRSEPDGFVPFDRVMDVALYAPEVGYYARSRTPFGPEGDFYTAPAVHPLFAETIARRFAEVHGALGRPRRFRLIDLGSGDGKLAAGVLHALVEARHADGVEVVVVDRSEARRTTALAEVTAVGPPHGVPATAAASLASVGPVVGVVIAHELLDALPARQLRWDGAAWLEVGFELGAQGLLRAVRPLEGPVPAPALPRLAPDDAGTLIEVSPAAEAIVREVADHLVHGILLVVDFGAEGAELYRGHPAGTVAGVREHRSVPVDPTTFGAMDISAFVNFTRVRWAAARAGLAELRYVSQAEALAAWGIEAALDRAVRRCRSAEDEVRVRLAAKNLLFGFGAFRVLELAPRASAERLRPVTGASRAGSS